MLLKLLYFKFKNYSYNALLFIIFSNYLILMLLITFKDKKTIQRETTSNEILSVVKKVYLVSI